MGSPTEKEPSSVKHLGDRGEQGSASDLVGENKKGEHKPGLLVVLATVKGFKKPWSILIDSGASSNYVRRRSFEGSQTYVEALKAHDDDRITVRLATGVRVTVPKVPCLVLDLDSRHDLILGMVWLERHESWIDWRSKTLNATRIVSDKALESHELTFAKKQKRYWRELLTESVSVLDIGVSELIDPHVNENSVEQCSETRSEATRTPLCDTRSVNVSLNAASIVGLEPVRQGLKPSNVRGVARINPPSDAGCIRDSLDVGNDIGSDIEHVKLENLVIGVGYNSDPLDVGNDIGSRVKVIEEIGSA